MQGFRLCGREGNNTQRRVFFSQLHIYRSHSCHLPSSCLENSTRGKQGVEPHQRERCYVTGIGRPWGTGKGIHPPHPPPTHAFAGIYSGISSTVYEYWGVEMVCAYQVCPSCPCVLLNTAQNPIQVLVCPYSLWKCFSKCFQDLAFCSIPECKYKACRCTRTEHIQLYARMSGVGIAYRSHPFYASRAYMILTPQKASPMDASVLSLVYFVGQFFKLLLSRVF